MAKVRELFDISLEMEQACQEFAKNRHAACERCGEKCASREEYDDICARQRETKAIEAELTETERQLDQLKTRIRAAGGATEKKELTMERNRLYVKRNALNKRKAFLTDGKAKKHDRRETPKPEAQPAPEAPKPAEKPAEKPPEAPKPAPAEKAPEKAAAKAPALRVEKISGEMFIYETHQGVLFISRRDAQQQSIRMAMDDVGAFLREFGAAYALIRGG